MHRTTRLLSPFLLSLAAAAPLAAQTIDTVGGTTTAPLRTALAKANLFRVDSTVLLLQFEMYLNVPGQETLTFFIHGHHSRSGVATLRFSQQVPVNGTGLGAAWYSSGPIAVPLVCGNHYQIGVAWSGSLTYHYTTVSAAGTPVSFGMWARGNTPSSPVPPTWTFSSGHDSAQYYQRLTTVPLPAVGCVGQPCANGATLAPRLVANSMLSLGAVTNVDLVDAQASMPAVFAFVLGASLPAPVPLLGCNLWIDATNAATSIVFTSSTGIATVPLAVPQNTAFLGVPVGAQAGVLGTVISLTNALDFVVG